MNELGSGILPGSVESPRLLPGPSSSLPVPVCFDSGFSGNITSLCTQKLWVEGWGNGGQ